MLKRLYRLFTPRGVFTVRAKKLLPEKFMNRFSLRLALVAALALFVVGCNGKRVAVVNTDMVYKESVFSEKGTEHLRAVSAEMQKAYEEADAKVKNAKNKQEETAAQEAMQASLLEMQQRLNAEQQQVVAKLTDAYKQAMDICRTKGNYEIILPTDVALSYAPSADITAQVIQEMNTMSVEFTPIKPETPAENPAE